MSDHPSPLGVHENFDGTGFLTYINGHVLGEFYREVDGYYVFVFAEPNVGCWEAHVLREIADTLDEMNAPWDAEVKAHFENQQPVAETKTFRMGRCPDPNCDLCTPS